MRKMKKVLTFASFATIMGLSFFGFESTKIDSLLGTEPKDEKTYMVQVEGDVTGNNKEKADVTRRQVLAQVKFELDEDTYEITHVYDTLYNGFAIKTNAYNAALIEKTLGVKKVSEAHVYARPEVTVGGPIWNAASEDTNFKAEKLHNYSAETMHATGLDIFNATGEETNYGEGITIGILDTGLFYNQVKDHSVRLAAEAKYGAKLNAPAFQELPAGVETTLTKETIAERGYAEGRYTYVNNKIPFAYDFAGNDTDVDPKQSDNEHGTHVASMAAANGDDFKGIARNAQVAVLKVFPDQGGGASTPDIIEAMEAAAKLKLDVINLSLGTDLIDNEDSLDDETYKTIVAANNAGVIVNYSAGNAGKSSFSSGNYADFTTDTAETGILGSSANFDEAANIIASSNPDKAFFDSIMNVTQVGSAASSAVAYSDQVISSSTQTFAMDRRLTDLMNEYNLVENMSQERFDAAIARDASAEDQLYVRRTSAVSTEEHPVYIYTRITAADNYRTNVEYFTATQKSSAEVEYIYIPGFGEDADFLAVGGIEAVRGKVAIINRGNTTFVSKYQNAQKYGAIAMVCVNNNPSTTFNFSMAFNDNSPDIPVVFVFQNTKSIWSSTSAGGAGKTGTIVLQKNIATEAGNGNSVSSFSSDGPSSNLDIGPTVSAPGYQTIGAVDATESNAVTGDANNTHVSGLYGYENLSGTSMAAPNFTGALALVLGEKKAEGNEVFERAKETISAKAMASADQLMDGTKETENSPRLQGAGRVNAAAMLKADSFLTTGNFDDDDFEIESQYKAELKNKGSLYVEDADFDNAEEAYIEFPYTIHNDSSTARTYEASLSVMIPALRIQTTHAQYEAEEESSRSEEIGYDPNVSFDKDDMSTYPYSVGIPTMTVNDQMISVGEDGKAGYTSLAGTITVPAATNGNEGVVTGTVRFRIDNLNVKTSWEDSVTPDFDGTLKEYFNQYFKYAGGSFVEGYLKLESKVNNVVDDDLTLTMPYLGFYGDYTVADAVEPFDFEKEKGHLYNSELADNYLQHLNDNYKKPNAYTGSTLSASSSAQNNFADLASFAGSFKPNGIKYLTVANDEGKLYAGAPGISEHLNAVFYINRSLTTASYELINKNGTSVKNGDIKLLYARSSTSVEAVPSNQLGLPKSMLFSLSDGSGYSMYRGVTDIDLSRVAEGDYKLRFNFTLKGVLDANGANHVQTKEYDLTVDKTAPSLASATLDSQNRLTIVANGANDVIKIGFTGISSTLVEGTENQYYAKVKLKDREINDNFVAVTLYDFAHNEYTVLLHPDNLTFAVGSTFFTNKNDYFLADFDPENHGYTVSLIDAKGDDMIVPADFDVYVQLATGLSKDTIVVRIDSAICDEDKYDYDSTTGILTIHMDKDSAAFAINYAPINPSEKDSSSTPDSSSTSPDSSSTAPAPSTDSSSSTTPTPEPEKKGGCGGSVIAATSSVAALGAFATALALKKKREDK